MQKHDRHDIAFSQSFRQLSYAEYIKQYIFNDKNISDGERGVWSIF